MLKLTVSYKIAKIIFAFYGLILGLLIFSFLAKNGYLNSSYKLLIVLSGSMEPQIKTGSLVITKSEKNYKVKDVVAFESSNNDLVTHRIEGITNAGFVTKGDANNTTDPGEILNNQVKGKVIFTIPYLGRIANISKNPKGFIAVVIIPATIIVYEELVKIKKEIANFIKTKKLKNNKSNSMPNFAILVPFIALAFMYTIATNAYYSDSEKSTQNSFTASNNF